MQSTRNSRSSKYDLATSKQAVRGGCIDTGRTNLASLLQPSTRSTVSGRSNSTNPYAVQSINVSNNGTSVHNATENYKRQLKANQNSVKNGKKEGS
jgi:hypothetical protein